MESKDRLIFALDVESLNEAEDWVCRLKDYAGVFKVGKELFTRCGPEVVEKILNYGSKVFLDLKFHDIPTTAAKAGIQAAKLGVSIFNVHAFGGREMMTKVADEVKNVCVKDNIKKPLIMAVTILTSLGEKDIKELGINRSLPDEVAYLAKLAMNCGLDGVVCSPKEIGLIKGECGKDFKVITPGIRSSHDAPDDQKRSATASEAIKLGADFIVVGRPIRSSPDPVEAARKILEEIEN